MAIGERIIAVRSVDSTNKMAAELLAAQGSAHGTVILAHEQTAGRGRRGRRWASAPGLDIALSVVLKPAALAAADQFGLAKLTALAVADTVREALGTAGDGVAVKWPNDVLVGRRKVAGILIECELAGDRVRHAIVGIGLNVNSVDLPEELLATSLRTAAGGRMHDRDAVVHRLLAAMERRYAQWLHVPAGLDADYTAALWARGRWAPMWLDGAAVDRRPVDVDPHGRLLVEDPEGRVAAYGLDRLRFAAR